jgi:hypothetical protein
VNARELLAEVRRELEPLNSSVLNCRFLLRAERGELSFEDLRAFVENQLYIVSHDAKSIALMAARATHAEESAYFADLARADLEALGALEEMAEELGAAKGPVHSLKVIPHAVDYTHFLAFLAAHRNPGEQAFALIVNLPRLVRCLREAPQGREGEVRSEEDGIPRALLIGPRLGRGAGPTDLRALRHRACREHEVLRPSDPVVRAELLGGTWGWMR